MRIKTILIIMLMTLITLSRAKSTELKEIDKNPPSWFLELNESEKWEVVKDLYNKYVELLEIAKEENADNDELIKQLKKNNNFLKSYKPFYPNFAFSVGYGFMIDKQLDYTSIIDICFYKYFFKGKFFLSPGVNFRINDFGAGINLKLGVVF